MSLSSTPRANRLHIGIFGKRNSGKSSLINALTGHEVAVVSDFAGTTTDPVYKSMELYPIGPVVFVDTAGFDDEGELGELRINKTLDVVKKTDIAIVLFEDGDLSIEEKWLRKLGDANVPIIPVVNKSDIYDRTALAHKITMVFGINPLVVSANDKESLDSLKNELSTLVPEDFKIQTILKGLAQDGDHVLLVMPQDIQAPKGRLILPQVQTIRELLDNRCIVTCTTLDKLEKSLQICKEPPKLIITDSQCFGSVYKAKDDSSNLTSFSVLFASYKGDINEFVKGANVISSLNENSRVLIAEACTHAPLEEDIGREQIPRMLRERYGENMTIDIVSGSDFPEKLFKYDLIIHCAGCMFNRKYMMSRINEARAQSTKITNYGITMAYLNGILDKIVYK